MLQFIEYQSKHKEIFKELGEEWIKKYMTLIDHDQDILADPEGKILAKGGEIIFAELDGKIVGTAALTRKDNDRYELSKLGVTESAKGQGIGKKLTLEIIRRAQSKGISELYLETNQVLKIAISLYKKLGFVDLNEVNRTPQCDVQMVLKIN